MYTGVFKNSKDDASKDDFIMVVMFVYGVKFAAFPILSFNQDLYIKVQAQAILTSLFYLLNNSCM